MAKEEEEEAPEAKRKYLPISALTVKGFTFPASIAAIRLFHKSTKPRKR